MLKPAQNAQNDWMWKDQRYDYDAFDNLIYHGFNDTNGAATSDTDWYVFKFTYDDNSKITRKQGPEIGSWDNRVGLSW